MNDEALANGLFDEVVKNALHEYGTQLDSLSPTEISDTLWHSFFEVYAKCRATGNEDAFLNAIRLVIQDTVSHVLGIIDGTTPLRKEHLRLELRSENGEVLSGCLQDYFLSRCEEDG